MYSVCDDPNPPFIRNTLYTEHTTLHEDHLGLTLKRRNMVDGHLIGTKALMDPGPTHFHGLGIGTRTRE